LENARLDGSRARAVGSIVSRYGAFVRVGSAHAHPRDHPQRRRRSFFRVADGKIATYGTYFDATELRKLFAQKKA
jgi:ketosteroid isomerase-like protein